MFSVEAIPGPKTELKRYNTTQFCDVYKVSSTSTNGWVGTWYTKSSTYSDKSGISICLNRDQTLHFYIFQYGLTVAGITGIAKLSSGDRAEGFAFDGESPADNQLALDCQVVFVKDATSIKTKVTGKECNLYSGVHSSIESDVYFTGINLEPKPIKDAEVDDQQCVGEGCKEIYSTVYDRKVFINDEEYQAFKTIIKNDEDLFSRNSDGYLYLIAFNQETKKRVYNLGSWNYVSGKLILGQNNTVWALIESGDDYKYFTNVPGEKETMPQEFSSFIKTGKYPYDGSGPFKGKIIYMNK
jgi:hypothetical protein